MRMIKKRLLRIFIFGVIGLTLAGLITYMQVQNEFNPKNSAVVTKNFAGPINLTDENGEVFTDDNFQKGQYRLIYFGFTYCPAICPTELQRMSTVIKNLGDKGNQVDLYFITVDPERDTVDVVKQYTDLFHPRLIGLTGDQDQIDQAKKSYKIYAAKVQDETMTEYTMDHSSYIYFIDDQNNLIQIFKADDSIDYMTKFMDQNIQ
jgi:protein SCO1/2